MSRPENVSDIEIEDVEFATVQVNQISVDPLLLKGYQLMLEQLTKAGATVTTGYSGVTFARKATAKEAEDQLKSKQSTWDHLKKLYDQFAAVGELEHSYMESSVKSWAAQEGLPYPPPHEPISSFDAVIRGIEEVVSE